MLEKVTAPFPFGRVDACNVRCKARLLLLKQPARDATHGESDQPPGQPTGDTSRGTSDASCQHPAVDSSPTSAYGEAARASGKEGPAVEGAARRICLSWVHYRMHLFFMGLHEGCLRLITLQIILLLLNLAAA